MATIAKASGRPSLLSEAQERALDENLVAGTESTCLPFNLSRSALSIRHGAGAQPGPLAAGRVAVGADGPRLLACGAAFVPPPRWSQALAAQGAAVWIPAAFAEELDSATTVGRQAIGFIGHHMPLLMAYLKVISSYFLVGSRHGAP